MDFEKIFKDLKDELLSMVKDKFDEESQSVKNDISAFFDSAKEKLKRWTELFVDGVITREEFELLLKSQKDLVIMKTLHKAGISAISLGHFKNAVISMIVDKVSGVINQ